MYIAKSKRKSEGIKLIPFILLLILYIPRMHMHAYSTVLYFCIDIIKTVHGMLCYNLTLYM